MYEMCRAESTKGAINDTHSLSSVNRSVSLSSVCSATGFGFAMVLLSFLIAVYGSVVVAWSVLYLFSSMNKEVPWQSCKDEWKIENCTEVYSGE